MTASVKYPRTNGCAEKAVHFVKMILIQPDPYLGLMSERNTSFEPTGFSPAQLMLCQRLKTIMPTLSQNLRPNAEKIDPDIENSNDDKAKEKDAY